MGRLAKRDKMIKLRYQQIASSKIPVATSADGQVIAKVIAGEALGVQAAIETRTLIMYLHFTLKPKDESCNLSHLNTIHLPTS